MSPFPVRNAADIQAIVNLVICALFTFPISIYCTYQICKNWNELWLIKRKRSVWIILFIMILYQSLIEMPSYSIDQLYGIGQIPELVLLSITIPTRIAFFLLINIRVWILYYNYHYHHTLAIKPWRILISPQSINDNWFVRHKRSLGDARYILEYILFPIVMMRVISFVVMRFIFQIDSIVVDGITLNIFFVSSFIFCAIVWTKYPDFNDRFFIRMELKFTFLWLLLAVILAAVIWLVFIYLAHLELDVGLLAHLGFEVTFSILMWIFCVYPQRALRKSGILSSNTLSQSLSAGGVRNAELMMSWKEIILSKDGYESFASFLSREFAIEV